MFLAAKFLGVLLTPLNIVILLALIGLLLQCRWRRLGLALSILSLSLLLAFSMPLTARALIHRLERASTVLVTTDTARQTGIGAIVVLGGGRTFAPEYDDSASVSAATLERIRYAVYLHRASGLPILVSGGSVYGEAVPEAELMRRILADDFRVPKILIEARSRNTLENAVHSAALLKQSGVQKVWLVTHAWHMPRALWSFTHTNIEVVPAPTGFHFLDSPFEFLPSAGALQRSSRAVNEHLGLLWYRIRYREPTPTQ